MPKQSLKKATKRSQHEARVQQLDGLGTDVGEFIMTDGLSSLETSLGSFIERVQANINAEKNFVTTGAINDMSIQAREGGIDIVGPAHLVFQDRGVSGVKKKYDTPHAYTTKMPPKDVFVQWIKDKKLTLTDKNDYHRKHDDRLSPKEREEDRPMKELTEEEQIDRAAWGMARKVFNEGIRPRHIYSKEIPKLVEDLQQDIASMTMQAINQVMSISPKEGGGNRIIIK